MSLALGHTIFLWEKIILLQINIVDIVELIDIFKQFRKLNVSLFSTSILQLLMCMKSFIKRHIVLTLTFYLASD